VPVDDIAERRARNPADRWRGGATSSHADRFDHRAYDDAGWADQGRGMSDGPAIALSLPPEMLDQLIGAVLARIELQPVENPEPWFDVPAAMTYLACRRKRIYELHAQGRLQAARDGGPKGPMRFRREWLDAALYYETDQRVGNEKDTR
jgi:hypothetical protein